MVTVRAVTFHCGWVAVNVGPWGQLWWLLDLRLRLGLEGLSKCSQEEACMVRVARLFCRVQCRVQVAASCFALVLQQVPHRAASFSSLGTARRDVLAP